MTRRLLPLVPLLLAAAQASAQRRIGYSTAEFRRAAAVEERYRGLVSSDSISAGHAAITGEPHRAGTPASLAVADRIAARLRAAGLDVSVHDYQAWLSAPGPTTVEMTAPTRRPLALAEPALSGDSIAGDPQVGPAFIAYSGAGSVEAPLVYVNYGLPDDYDRLAAAGVEVRGRIAVARYGKSHRAVKVHTAQERGVAAVILYSDPADDGAARGPVWPDGYWREEHLIQRGNAKLSWFWHGDPLTPGVPATTDAARLDPATAPTLPRIPVVAVAAAEARPLLQALGGAAVPAGFQGGLPFPYHAGPGPARVRLSVANRDGLAPIRNVIALIPGTDDPDELVLFGAHHDAWTFGGVDPGTGAAALMETARALGALARTGWRPRRTIGFAFWDAEEYGLVGSTEYAEEIKGGGRTVAVYVNTDMYMVGRFDPGGVPSLRDFVVELAGDLADQDGTVLDGWRESAWRRGPAERRTQPRPAGWSPDLKALGSGADFVPFQDHLGAATLSLEFIGANGYGFGTYHSSADHRAYAERVADPGFRQGAVLARLLGTAALRLGGAAVLPFRFSRYAEALAASVDQADRQLTADRRPVTIDFGPHRALVERIGRAARQLEAAVDSALEAGAVPGRFLQLNRSLASLETLLTDDEGPPDTRWFRHVVHGWNIYSLYDGQPFPGLFLAARSRDQARATREAGRIERGLTRLARALERLASP
ncbi:MAG: M28 family peptidase [Gemmatimonadales bacterium]